MIKTLFDPFQRTVSWNIQSIGLVWLSVLLTVWIFLPDSFGFPSPLSIANEWQNLGHTQGLMRELFTSTVIIWEAIFISGFISIFFAVMSSTDIMKPVCALVSSLRFLGFAGLTYLFTTWTSSSAELKLALLSFGMTVFLTQSMIDVVSTIPQTDIDYGRTLGMSGWKLTFEIVLRARLSELLDLVRQNAAVGWTILSMVEGITRSEGGIGALLLNQNKSFNLAGVLAIQLTILAYGLVQDMLLRYGIEIVCPWTRFQRGTK